MKLTPTHTFIEDSLLENEACRWDVSCRVTLTVDDEAL